jgi:hypothetical protein
MTAGIKADTVFRDTKFGIKHVVSKKIAEYYLPSKEKVINIFVRSSFKCLNILDMHIIMIQFLMLSVCLDPFGGEVYLVWLTHGEI